MNIKYLFLFLFVVIQTYGFAQSVDPLTGRPQINIPLWQISEGGLNIPIALYYQGGGVKVEASEGNAGISWHFSGSGAVSRDVKGLPDDYSGTGTDLRRGWLFDNLSVTINNFIPGADDNLSTCADEKNDYDFLLGLSYAKDTEPDIFSFSAPGLSGQFVFGSDGLPKQIPYQDLKTEVTRNATTGVIEQFKITTNTGIGYTFNITETNTRLAYKPSTTTVTHFNSHFNYYGGAVSYTSAWHLSNITSPGGAQISFNYIESEESQHISEVKVISETGVISPLYSLKDEAKPKLLNSIVAAATTVSLEWEGGRVSRVKINDTQFSTQKIYNLNYIYANDYRDTGVNPVKKAFLKSIKQESNCVSFPSYVFNYDGITNVNGENYTTILSFKDKNLQDLWGYYNGTSATKIPDIYIYSSASDAERYRINTLPGQTPTQTLSGAGRTANPTVISAGSLTSIEYPSGAVTTFQYEPNSYFDNIANSTYNGGGIRVKKVTASGGEKGSDNIVTDYEYLDINGQSSGKLVYRPVFAFADGSAIIRTEDNLAPDGSVLYSRTTVKQTGRGKTIYEFNNPGVYPSTTDSDWTATKSKIARYVDNQVPPPCNSIGNQHTGYYTFPFPQNTNYDFEQGLPSRISDYTENGTLVQERLFSYQRLTPGIIYVKGISFEKFSSNFVFGQYTIITNVGKVALTETTRRADDLTPANMVESSTTYTYSSVHRMLESLSTTNSDGIVYKTRYKYAKDFSAITNPNPAKTEAVAIKSLNDTYRHGEIIEMIQSRLDGTENVTGATITLYKNFGTGKILPERGLVFPSVSGFTEAIVITNGSSQHELSFHTGYLPTSTFQSYNSIGLPQSITDQRKNKTGVHYGFFGTKPVAQVANAIAEEIVYDGFESATGFGLTYTGSPVIVPGWTGNRAMSVIGGFVFRRDNIQKATGKYRFSCWMKSAGAAQVSFTALNGSTVQSSGNITYSAADANQWKYLEGELDMSAVSNSFSLEIIPNATAQLDEIRFLPVDASIASLSYDPLNGVTAQTDDRGISSFTDYDELGRVKYLKNQDKDVVQVNEYRYQKESVPQVKSNFTSNVAEFSMAVGNVVTFTAADNCLTGLTYAWKVNGVLQSSTVSTLNHTFSTAGQNTVELKVTHPTYGYSFSSVAYCVDVAPLVFSMQIQDIAGLSPPDKIFECDGNYAKQFTVTYQSGGCGSSGFTYQWQYQPFGDNTWTIIDTTTSPTITTSYITTTGYYIRCLITQDNCAGNTTTGCFYNNWATSASATITYIDEPTCQ